MINKLIRKGGRETLFTAQDMKTQVFSNQVCHHFA